MARYFPAAFTSLLDLFLEFEEKNVILLFKMKEMKDMTPMELRTDLYERTLKIHGDILAQTQSLSLSITRDAMESVRTFSVVAGALATGSLVLISTDVPVDRVVVVIGVIFLFIELLLILGFLLHRQNSEAEGFIRARKEALKPGAKIILLYTSLRKKEIDGDHFDTESQKIMKEQLDGSRIETEKILTEDLKTDNWDVVFLGFLLQGLFFIGYGILSPYYPLFKGLLTSFL